MPRRPRLRIADVTFHVIQRGNNRGPCFFRDADYRRYLADLGRLAIECEVAIHAYVLMTNHAHLLLTPARADGISCLMKRLGQLYVQYVNRVHDRTGSLWEGRFRSCLVDSERYALVCHRYIEMNPVRAGMAGDPAEYPWSSHRANAHGAADPLLTEHPVLAQLAADPRVRQRAYRELFDAEPEHGVEDEIRAATNGGFALGPATFQRRMARALGRPVTPQRSGPKPAKRRVG